MPCHGLWKLYVRTCLNLSLSPQCKGNRLPLKPLCVVCTHCGAYQSVRKSKHMAPCGVFFPPSPEACLADSHSIAGGREG